jgi:hypothetical protein
VDRLALTVARCLPRRLRYWVTVDSIVRATSGPYGNTVVSDLKAVDVLNRIWRGGIGWTP